MTLPDLARWLNEFFAAVGYATAIDNRILEASERRGLHAPLRVLIGPAASITYGELRNREPTHIVVEEEPTPDDLDRLQKVCDESGLNLRPASISQFIDQLWLARAVAEHAMVDAKSAEDVSTLGFERNSGRDPMDMYVNQWLSVDGNGGRHYALQYVEDQWIGRARRNRSLLAVLGDAGTGKSELVRVLQWRAAYRYITRSRNNDVGRLPPLALRVPARDLRGLSLEGFAEYLRPFDETANPQLLGQLLRYRRLILLLDGLDEFPRLSELDQGLRELQALANFGGQILITSRTGYFTEGPVRAALGRQVVAVLEPLGEAGSIELLTSRYDAHKDAATRAVQFLPEPVRGYPLFVILAWLSDFRGGRYLSDMHTLRQMTELFCRREELRFGMSESRQMQALRQLAYDGFVLAAVSRRDVLKELGDEGALFVDGPHPLLSIQEDELYFRYETFNALFLADAINHHWRDAATDDLGSWLAEALGRALLPPLACEYLAELLTDDLLPTAWIETDLMPVLIKQFVRGNLLGVGLRKIQGVASDRTPAERATALAKTLGGRDLRNTHLGGLSMERFDFRGWNLSRCGGEGAYFGYCNFAGATFGAELEDAEFVECAGIAARPSREKLVRRGQARLEAILRPWRDYSVSRSSLRQYLPADAWGVDVREMDLLRARGLVHASGSGDQRQWSLTPSGVDVLSEFALTGGGGNAMLADLLFVLGSEAVGSTSAQDPSG
jgi:hypothetical protein